MTVFAFGSFRPKVDISRLLETLAQQMGQDFGLSIEVRKIDEDSHHHAELAFVDVSRELQSLHISGLGKVSRLFVINGGPAKATAGLKQFLQSLSSLHGRAVKFIYDHQNYQEHVYQVEAVLNHTALGFHAGDTNSPLDVRELASALYQEYYSLRLDQIKQNRIDHIVSHLAEQVMAVPEMAASSGEAPVVHVSEEPQHNDSDSDLLPVVMEEDALKHLYEQLRLELDVYSTFSKQQG